MDLRIGRTMDGQAVRFDTSTGQPLLLVGDGGRGKTTTARYLTRWWLADTTRHAHVLTVMPGEWADLRCTCQHPDEVTEPVGQGCRAWSCLLVVEDLHLVSDQWLTTMLGASTRTIFTSPSSTNLVSRPLVGRVASLGLVGADPPTPSEAAVREGQGRLDWPIGTVPVIPDPRGPTDFPCHRWAPATAAATGVGWR